MPSCYIIPDVAGEEGMGCEECYKELVACIKALAIPVDTVKQYCVLDIFNGKLVCPNDFKTIEEWEEYAYRNFFWDILYQTQPEIADQINSIRAGNGLKPFESTFLEDVKDENQRKFVNDIFRKRSQKIREGLEGVANSENQDNLEDLEN
jgi:hypothetical protein